MPTQILDVRRHMYEWGRPARVPIDWATVVAIYVGLLFLIPSRLVLPSLGASGQPAVMFGLAAGFVWAVSRILAAPRRGAPVRLAVVSYIVALLMSYAVAFTRPLTGLELRSMDRAMLSALSWLGIVLAASEIRSRARLNVVLTTLFAVATVMAAIGALQFFTGINLAQHIRLPGLVYNAELIGIGERGAPGFRRVASTANHYIEFGVVLSVVLPVALHAALSARPERRVVTWVAFGLIALGIPLSISRSAVFGLLIGGLGLVLSWRLRARLNAIVIGIVGMITMRLFVPGLLGTIRSLFSNVEDDPSIEGRTSDYGPVFEYFRERPYFGRGPRSFVPDLYRVLDNEWLNALVTIGIVGVGALASVFVVSWSLGRRLRKRARDPEVRHLGQALAAAILAAGVTAFTFDALAFSTFAGTLFVLVGCLACLWRLERDGRAEVDRFEVSARFERLLKPVREPWLFPRDATSESADPAWAAAPESSRLSPRA